MNAKNVVFSSILILALTGCATSVSADGAETSGRQSQATEAAADISGTWTFDVAASDVAAPLRARCAEKAGRDPAKEAACWAAIQAEAAREKVRFGAPASPRGPVVWTSFAVDGDRETVFLQMPLELTADGPGHLLAKVAGPRSGAHADAHAPAAGRVTRIELVDARTIAIVDPAKGRLVYVR
jgi:hypothetical protein